MFTASVNLMYVGQPALMAFGLSGSLSACFMYIFALSCVSTEWQIKMLACLLTTSTKVLSRAARIAETITAGRPTYIKFTQVVNKTNPQPTQPQETKYTYRCSVISNFKCNLTSQNCITGGHMKYKIENNRTSYPLISVNNSILVNFMSSNFFLDQIAPLFQFLSPSAVTLSKEPLGGSLNTRGLRKIRNFQSISRYILETVKINP